MFLKGASKLSTEIARDLIRNGFKYEDIREIVKNRTHYKGRDIEYFEDELFKKIEKFSKYLRVINISTGEEYYYFTVKDLCEDTGLSTSAVNGGIYGGSLVNLMLKVERLSFSSKELCKDKTDLLDKRLGKLKPRKYYAKGGKYMSKPLLVIDTHTDQKKIYKTARLFCKEFNIESNNLAKYIRNNWRVMSRYEIAPYLKEIWF